MDTKLPAAARAAEDALAKVRAKLEELWPAHRAEVKGIEEIRTRIRVKEAQVTAVARRGESESFARNV